MQLIACQHNIQWENREANFDAIRKLLSEYGIKPGALIVLPEMFSSGFSMNVARVAEATPSLTESFLAEIAQEYESWTLGGLVYQLADGKGSNELSVFDPSGQRIGHYQKNHCFSYTGESDHYESGEDVLLFDWQGFKVCPVICYDLRFPELFRRSVKASTAVKHSLGWFALSFLPDVDLAGIYLSIEGHHRELCQLGKSIKFSEEG